MLEVKKYYTEEDMILLDEKIRFIPLTYDKLFKGIFKDKLDIRREKLKYGTDKLVTYGMNSNETYNDNKIVLVKYLEYYRDLYYNKTEKEIIGINNSI